MNFVHSQSLVQSIWKTIGRIKQSQVVEHVDGGANESGRVGDVLVCQSGSSVAGSCFENGVVTSNIHTADKSGTSNQTTSDVRNDVS